MYWYMCRLDASHRCLVVNKDLPFVAVHFVAFVVVPVARIHRTVVGIHRTCRSVVLLSCCPVVLLSCRLLARTRRSHTSHTILLLIIQQVE